MINHNIGTKDVMLIEISDFELVLSIIFAFIIGLGGLYVFYKYRSSAKPIETKASSLNERLEYYEAQLIDMKIRLDSLELQGIEGKKENPDVELKQFLEKLVRKEELIENASNNNTQFKIQHDKIPEIEPVDSNDITESVLHLITDKDMTSRDIQKMLKRSREHTSRLMKKLFEEGLVERNTKTKPYTYSITEKGKERIGVIQTPSIV